MPPSLQWEMTQIIDFRASFQIIESQKRRHGPTPQASQSRTKRV